MSDILQGNTDPIAEPDLGRQARAVQRAARQPPPGGREDRHRERRAGPRDVRLPAQARRPRTTRAMRWASGWATATTRCRAPRIPRPRSTPLRRCGTPSSATSRGAEPVAAVHARPKGVVRRRIDAWTGGGRARGRGTPSTEWFIAGTQPGGPHRGRPQRPPVSRGVRHLAGRPAQGRARTAGVGRRRRWAGCRRARQGVGVGGPARLADRILLGEVVLGRAHRRCVRQAATAVRARGEAAEGARPR